MSHDDVREPEEQATIYIEWDLLRRKSLQPGGFNKERTRLWPKLLHVDLPESALCDAGVEERIAADVYSELHNSTDSLAHQDERQIGLDTDRSFVLYPVGRAVEDLNGREHLQAQLHQLIVTVFRRRRHLHYFQGYHDIISVMFLTLPKEIQIRCVEKLSLHRLRDSMGTSLEPVVGLLRVLKRLLEAVDPAFSSLLDRVAPLPYFSLSNLLTLLSHDVPSLPLIQHIFDYLLCRPPIAIVYMVAATVLSRREEAFQMEKEGEEGTIHSLLSSLPELYEEDEAALPAEAEDPAGSTDIAEVKSGESKAVHEEEVTIDTTNGDTVDQQSNNGDALEEDDQSDNVLYAGQDDDVKPSEDPSISDDKGSSDVASVLQLDQLPVETGGESMNENISGKSSRSPSPAVSDHLPPRPRASLTSLFMHADDLYARYPPSHPSIALSSIMGPQSVMLTWSEDPSELPEDDEAELMVDKPELVVLPYIEPEDEVASDEEYASGVGGRKMQEGREAERRRRRRLRKPRGLVIQHKAMVAGAVLVLGVAMAVYGMQTGGQAGLFRGDARNHHHTISKEWKRMSQVVGGVLLGVGERMVDGLWR